MKKGLFLLVIAVFLISCSNKKKIDMDKIISKEISIQRDSVKIYGTLVKPNIDKKVPVVLIIAGSGPTDRNGNNKYGVRARPYKLLADELVKNGIATVRYDKRAIGKSTVKGLLEMNLRFDDYVDDAAEWIRKLKADTSFSKIIVAGHSEGSLIGAVASLKEKPNGFISLAGAGLSADSILIEQLSRSKDIDLKEVRRIIKEIEQGKIAVVQDKDLQTIFRATVQPYLRSWFRYNPKDVFSKLSVPVLIIQGTTDLQVPIDNAYILDSACSTDKLIIIEGMGHILKDAPMDRQKNLATYFRPDLPLNKELVENIINFVDTLR